MRIFHYLLFLATSLIVALPPINSNASVVINEIAWPVKAAYAANGLKMGTVVINEVAWMGTQASYNDEWLELYNNTDGPVALEGFILKSEDGGLEIKLAGTISGRSFYLLERTDDTTLPAIPADLIYKGALGNGGEDLKLYDNLNNLIDEVNCSAGWFYGNNQTKQTMEKSPTGWQTSENPGGTPKTQNSAGVIPQSSLPLVAGQTEPTSTPQNSPEVGPPPTYSDGVVFNEILPSPEGPDQENEWLEIYNAGQSEADVSGWQIRDLSGATKTYTLPSPTKIKAKDFLVLSIKQTKITLQNNGDGLELLNPDGKIIDKISFEKAITGQSFNKSPTSWLWSTTLTPARENIITAAASSPGEPNEKISNQLQLPPTAAKAEGVEQNAQKKNFLIVFLVAILIAIGSAVFVFFLKKSDIDF